MHPWHSISYGSDLPSRINGIVEISNGSKFKYELDKESGLLRLDRILENLTFPFNYGFIPQTLYKDNDPLDVVILGKEALLPLSLVELRILGGLDMLDSGKRDDKIIAVANCDKQMSNINSISDISQDILNEIRFFFQNYKKQDNREVIAKDFLSIHEINHIILESIDLYKKNKLHETKNNTK